MQKSNSSARRTHRTSRASLASLTALAVAVLISANLSGCSSLYSETATAGAGIGGAAIAGQSHP